MERLEPAARGRPAKPEPEPESELELLKKKVKHLEVKFELAQGRVLTSIAFPNLVKDREPEKTNGNGRGSAGGEASAEEGGAAEPATGLRALAAARRAKAFVEKCVRKAIEIFGMRKEREKRLPPERRGMPGQRKQREAEKLIRRHLMALAIWATKSGLRMAEAGAGLGLLPDTLRKRKCLWKGSHIVMRVLRWPNAGRVWSMDFFEPPCLIDGICKYVLLVRDLGSRKLLSALPTATADSSVVMDHLSALVSWYGVPVVAKSDNGSPLVSHDTRRFWESRGVKMLLSPPYYPRYNGSAEAGGGTVKVKAFFDAALEDRPESWDSDDIEFAKCQANDTPRRDLPLSPTPDRLFKDRLPVSEREREEFLKCYYEHESHARRELGFFEGIDLGVQGQARVDRIALSKALLEKGYLQFRRRRITPPISLRKLEKIS